MSKLLAKRYYLTYVEPTNRPPATWSVIVKQKQQDAEEYLTHHRKREEQNREKVFFYCISREMCLSNIENSDGLLIKLKNNGKSCDFYPFDKNIPLGLGDFAISQAVIIAIFSVQEINSLIVYPCENDSIVIEIAKDRCGDDGAGGDGYKVKLP
ncbi:hypothetical protein LV89_04442 [Arcicella aurantiaca]|uniref:Uncharacterized protein n=1 Tax=Arcicella aurantiaca TaxID=591202 RepID=A0A316DGL9_9BACT|nr:hypothetical protein [Arcicella aurantiaca]PWK17341.1 hypothetical protein LV89_04442 [Arcicella aurantiaca]